MRTVETLEERYRDDPVLLRLCKKKLPIKGWAGQLDDCEREYLRQETSPRYASKVERASEDTGETKQGLFRASQGRLEGF